MRSGSVAIPFCLCLAFTVVSGQHVRAQEPDRSDPLIRIGEPASLYSEILQEDRTYWVHLPESYSDTVDGAYPVIYLLDGALHLGGLAAIQTYYNYFRLPEMIVVGIFNGDNRVRDLTPTAVASRNGAAVEESGGADAFRSFLSEELIPHIDARYSTSSHRVLAGHSYGGLFVIDTLIEQSDLFRNYIALDPSLDWDNGQWLEQSLGILSDLHLDGHSLFVAISNEIVRFSDTLSFETVRTDSSPFSLGIRSTIRFVETQDTLSNGLSFSWKFYEKDIHGSVPLVGMRDALVDIYDFWELKKPSLYNDPDTPVETILTLIQEQSHGREAGMGYSLPMELDLLELLSHFYADTGQARKAKAVLSLTSEYYPDVRSPHESLVELCIELNDRSCAWDHALAADGLTGTSIQRKKVEAAFDRRE